MVECDIFQGDKGDTVETPAKLQQIPMFLVAWNNIFMDLIAGLPKSSNKYVIMVVVDHFSKHAHICSLRHPFKTSMVAQVFLYNFFKLHGTCHNILS